MKFIFSLSLAFAPVCAAALTPKEVVPRCVAATDDGIKAEIALPPGQILDPREKPETIAVQCQFAMLSVCATQAAPSVCLAKVSEDFLAQSLATRSALINLAEPDRFRRKRLDTWLAATPKSIIADAQANCGRDEMTMLAQQFASAYQDLSIPEICALSYMPMDFSLSLGWRRIGYQQSLLPEAN